MIACGILALADPKSPIEFEQQFGVALQLLPDYLALMGDSIDNIIGVPGVGAKTAATLLQHYQGIPEILANVDALDQLPIRGAKTLADKIKPFADQLTLNLQLTTIRCDIPLYGWIVSIAPAGN